MWKRTGRCKGYVTGGKKLHLDIQAQLKGQIPEITNELWESSNLDIQAQLDTKPIEITFILSTLPCLDIQVQLDRAFSVGENVAISCRR